MLVLVLVASGCSGTGLPDNVYAWNYPAEINSGGVVIQIGRVLIAEKTAYKDEFLEAPYFEDKPVVVEVFFVVRNDSGITMNIFPEQGVAVVGGEQIDLHEAYANASTGEYLSGQILPGITKIGGLWFGLRRTPLDQVQKLDIIISAPWDNSMNTYGSEYHFQIDLSERKTDPIPDEFK